MAGKIIYAQENYCEIYFIQVKITNNISNKNNRSTGCREIKTLQTKVMSRSEFKFFLSIPCRIF